MKNTAELRAQISEIESTKRQMILEIKTRPSEDDEQKSGGGGSVSESCAGTAFGGRAEKAFYGQTKMDSHADTTVAGWNCVPIWNTERSCDVAPFSDMYEPMKYVAIVSAPTLFKSTTARQYILVFCECLYIPELSHTLINPNQLRHFQTQVQDNPYVMDPMSIISPDGNFITCLESEGINIFINAWSPTQEDLALLTHIEFTSQQP